MRFVIYGGGAIGGVVGGRLVQSGQDVTFITRGDHLEAIRRGGLRIESPHSVATLRIDAVASPVEAAIGPSDAVLLTMKTHDVEDASRELSRSAPADTVVVAMQNGVEAERILLRRFRHVIGVSVVCPTAYLEPGVVRAYAGPTTGLLDLGRHPGGSDEAASRVAAAFRAATFESIVRADIMCWKYAKLLSNLGNAVEAICGQPARGGELDQRAQSEGRACFAAARIDISEADDLPERRKRVAPQLVSGTPRPGGSSWQSLGRRAGAIETDYLNGEIVLLGRLHGVETPVNELLQRLANQGAAERRPPGWMAEAAVRELLAAAPRDLKAGRTSRTG
jgi:2-dehydropantoate 2-reductase